jgi:4,5:9,10-diseco-3-hydroxy-5,9,17-trioxoandrosta-1(10),2-diene-4-oate hydrolase
MSATVGRPMQDWRRIDWRGLVNRAPVGGAEISYADLGSGEPAVLLVHGLGAQWRVWLPTIGPISKRRRVIAADLPGFGNSPLPPRRVSVAGFADALEELCEGLGLGPVVAVGNSLGGAVSAQLALAHPERVERLVLVNAVGIVPSFMEWARTLPFIWAGAVFGGQVSGARRQIASRARLRKAALWRVVHRPELLDADLVYHGVLHPPGPGARDGLAAGIEHLTPEWQDRLRRIACPTLVIWGEDDQLLPMRHAEEWIRRIPNSRLITFERTGHIPMVEQPEQFNAALLDFIEEEDGDAVAEP